MFNWDIVESFVLIALITAAIVSYAVVLGRREDREAGSPAEVLKGARTMDEVYPNINKKTA